MIPLPNIAEPTRQIIIGATVTSLQKFFFVLIVAVNLWKFSTTKFISRSFILRKPRMQCLRYSATSNKQEGCDSFWSIYSSPRCIKSLFLRDESEVFATGANKWHFLFIVIVRTLHSLAPYVFMISLFLITTFGIILLADLTKGLLTFRFFRRARTRFLYWTSSVQFLLSFFTLKFDLPHILCYILASLSYFIYLFASQSKICDTTPCLYYFSRLMKTFFQDISDQQDSYYQNVGNLGRFLFETMKIVTINVFLITLIVYAIVLLCFAVYVSVDAAISMWKTGKLLKQYFSMPSRRRNDVQQAWDESIASVKGLLIKRGGGNEARE